MLMGLHGFGDEVQALPDDPEAVIAMALQELDVAPGSYHTYLTALLMSVPGWAAACAFRRWEARLQQSDDDSIVHLLAVRLAWEFILYKQSGAPALAARWSEARSAWGDMARANRAAQEIDWLLQRAMELAYQEELGRVLLAPPSLFPEPAATRAQAVFCIDVRSEVFRRALEESDAAVQTLGFAGFFGLPVAYAPVDGVVRPQLPGLLAPTLHVHDVDTRDGASASSQSRALGAERKTTWKDLVRAPLSMFTAVEATGLGYAATLARQSLPGAVGVLDPLRGELAIAAGAQGDDSHIAPRLVSRADGSPLDTESRAQLAAGVLRGMSLTSGFAPTVAFIGHGATTENNPQAAGLACGACGGQSGEVNARVLAALLNEPAVRAELARMEIVIPDSTQFVAGLHDTVTDVVTLYDLSLVPASHARDVQLLQASLAQAGVRARRERAPRLGLHDLADRPDKLLAAMRRRSGDWSEVRPEWGLARNAAFIIAPRERTRSRNLDGRAFLHEYRWREDSGFAVLEAILTAPMLVTHWINMQYNASTVAPERFGSGDKVLHNVAGGDVGVFEGAGGDLRIGLARQSVHDGTDWVHVPLRLSVVVEAPAAAIDAILAKHPTVAALVRNSWLYLLRLDPGSSTLYRRRFTGWQHLSDGS